MVRRWLLLTGLGAVLLSGCGEPAETQARDPEPSSSSTTTSPADAPVEFRVVLASSMAPAPDSQVLQQFDGLDCDAPPVPVAPEEPMAACDDDDVKYVLEPARIVGGIESAVAERPNGLGWMITLGLDDDATRELADVTAELAVSQVQLAVVLDGRVVTAPLVQAPIPGGQLQISGDFTEEQASALADRLEG